MTKRKFGNIKSLLHFDYPYFNEPNDGLGDEVSSEVWTRVGNTKLAGSNIPYDVSGAPKFGYRCAYFPDTNSSISGTNTSGIFNLSPSKKYEFEAFVKYSSSAGNIFTIGDLTLGVNSSSQLTLSCPSWGIDETSEEILTTGTWYHVLLRISGGEVSVFMGEIDYQYYNGHTFNVFSNNLSWTDARAACEALGGHLATINSAEKQAFIETLIGSNANYWIGGIKVNNVWTWITGEEWNYTNWASGQPNNNGNPSEYLVIWNNNGKKWDDETNSRSCYYICEWDYITSSISEVINASITGNTTLQPETVALGGFVGYMDEFCFRHEARTGTPTPPTQPYSGSLNVNKVGGYGTGELGDVTISSNSQINSYGIISSITDTQTFAVSSWRNGTYTPAVGSEVMIHITAPKSTASADYPLVGLYAFRKIESISGTTVILDKPISTANGDDFTLDSSLLSTYYVQVITIPNFNSLTVNSGITVTPLTWGTSTGGGIVAFRCKGDCTINGSILTHSKGAIRYDWCQMTHSKLVDRFLCAQGGGIFATCGGTFTASTDARLGASWSGLGDNANGAAGYGANAGGVTGESAVGGGRAGGSSVRCGASGDGWGMPGGNTKQDPIADNYNEWEASIGGNGGGGQGNSGGLGGTGYEGYQESSGTINGGEGGGVANYKPNSGYYYYHTPGGGGGAPGGKGGNGGGYYNFSSFRDYYREGGKAGACLILLTNTLNILPETISTGGECPQTGGQGQPGGGGTGFCYIACKEQVSNS